jgi:hypothetical protein
MKKVLLLLMTAAGFAANAHAQPALAEEIKSTIKARQLESHIGFLASDEMRGRATGSPELDIAASYIASRYVAYGVKPFASAPDFFQRFNLYRTFAPSEVALKLADSSFTAGTTLAFVAGSDTSVSAPVVFAGYGNTDIELDPKLVKGKIVVVLAGKTDDTTPTAVFMLAPEKRVRAQAAGAAGLIELYSHPQVPFHVLSRYLSAPKLDVPTGKTIPHVWVKETGKAWEALLTTKRKKPLEATVSVSGSKSVPVAARNVIGWAPGTDSALKNQFIVITAHYDHVGVKKSPANADSIFNGARDNGIGTAALLSAARYFTRSPGKRPVLFAAVTAEEEGLLGSKYFAAHPPVPAAVMVFNLNMDGAGYNDTSLISVIGFDHVNSEALAKEAAEAFSLKAGGDPVPDQKLFYRTDHYHFALLGIPVASISTGITGFDQAIMKYYHQAADEPQTLDYDYLEKYTQAITYFARRLADMKELPYWKESSEFKKAGDALYNRKK